MIKISERMVTGASVSLQRATISRVGRGRTCPRFGENIRLSSYLANPLSKSQHQRADGGGCVGLLRATVSRARQKSDHHPMFDRPLSKPRQLHGAAITANSCPGTIIHFVAAAVLLMHAARPPRRPSRLGLGRRLASWHTRKNRRPRMAGDLTARADQQPNPKTRAAGHLLLPTSVRP